MPTEPTFVEQDRAEIHQSATKVGSLVDTDPAIPASRAETVTVKAIGTRDWRALGLLFASTILISAFLLFQVQPLISKYILPWFGGSPAVWTTCMLFFQLVLFGGYLYAHLLTRFFSPQAQGIVHLALMVFALIIMFPTVAPADSWKPLNSGHPTARILALLSLTVGLPYFVLSTTGPLVQAWFARAWPSKSPYRLYALSNIGSLAALVTYPFVFEPAFASDRQAGLWTYSFAIFAVLCGLCAAWLFRLPKTDTVDHKIARASSAPSLARRALWLALPACASLMLLATTNYVCQDVAVIPFLWVVPLALYLMTFIICFDHPKWFRPRAMSLLTIVSLILAAGAAYPLLRAAGISSNYLYELAFAFSAMFMACMICHGQLVRLRPDPTHLTEYYLLISAGGALGGIFVSLIAPSIFTTHFEWALGMAGSLFVSAVVLARETPAWRVWTAHLHPSARKIAWAGANVIFAIAIVLSLNSLLPEELRQGGAIYRGRNFYGTVSVWELDGPEGLRYRSFVSGSTPHGRQYVDPDKRHIPISYFANHTGMGKTLLYFQNKPDARVGIIGMGVGVVAAYAKPGQYYRFYEINQHVEDVAREYFTYLADCEGKCDVVIADGRLALERELATGNSQQFDVLALDAFSGDAPPVHLLTSEAFDIYLKHLKPDGVIVVNITNRYIDLAPVIKQVAKKNGMGVTRVTTEQDWDHLLYHTDFMMISKNQDFLAANPPVLIPKYVQPDYEVPLWTDKFSNLFSILKR
jgi:hypothetical protein